MLRRRLTVLLAIGVLVPLTTTSPSVGAVEPDLTVSATSGAARSVVEVSSASCVDEPDGSIWRALSVRLVSGAPGDEVLAAAGSSGEGEPARLAVPDWIDPADPAQIVAQCWEFDVSLETDDGEIPGVAVPYDPVAFDVLDPTEPAVQSVAFSRTALATGQGLEVDLAGCFLPGSLKAAGTELLTGTDRSGATGELAAYADVDLVGTAATVPLLLNDSGTFAGWSRSDDERPVVDEVGEIPSSLAPGPYVAFSFCAALDDAGVTYLYFPPEPIEVTGSSPMGDIDLRTEPGSHDVVLEGGSCGQPEVTGVLYGYDVEVDQVGFLRTSGAASPGAPVASALRPSPVGVAGSSGPRAISGDDATAATFTWTTEADGTWRVPEEAAFDLGFVRASASCGDPFGDGFSYDAQIAAIDVPPPVETTTTTTTTTTVAPPPPAQGVAGTPAYAG